jgi:hypothetical protein
MQIKTFLKSQIRPILFFGFLGMMILLAFYSNYNAQYEAKLWVRKVVGQVSSLEDSARKIVDAPQNETNPGKIAEKLENIKNLRSEITGLKNSNKAVPEDIAAKSFGMKSTYEGYLSSLDDNLKPLETRLNFYLEKTSSGTLTPEELLKFGNETQQDLTLQGKIQEYVKTNSGTNPLIVINKNEIIDIQLIDFKNNIIKVAKAV